MLQTYIRAASRGRGAAARTATTVARPQEGAALAAARRSTTTAARASIVHDKLVLTPAQRRRHIFNEALAMTPEARAGDGPHVTFLRALARRLLDPAVMLPHGRVHTAALAVDLQRADGLPPGARRRGRADLPVLRALALPELGGPPTFLDPHADAGGLGFEVFPY